MKYWIVVVDDEAPIRSEAKRILKAHGMRVTCLRSGQNLLKFMVRNDPDLILLDILMPEMDGFETYHALRRFEEANGKKRTPVIFVTSTTDTETEHRGLKAGVSDFIRKPFHPEILVRRIQNTVANNRIIENLTVEAAVDKLTGFWNKTAGTHRLTKICRRSEGALMLLDLDNFKLVNDLHGHETGDRVLMTFARVVRQNVREGDIVARIGGDEFMVFCCGMEDESGVAAFSHRLNRQFLAAAREVLGGETDIPLGVSVGAVMVPEYGTEYPNLFPLADSALYTAKQNGKHRHALYQPDTSGNSRVADLKKEIDRVTQILEERTSLPGALVLSIENFSFIYRFLKRFSLRYGGKAVKVLFVLSLKDPDKKRDFDMKEATARFCDCLKDSLRRSDIVLQNRPNQFFLILPALAKNDLPLVIQRIMTAWRKLAYYEDISVEYAVSSSVYEKNSTGSVIPTEKDTAIFVKLTDRQDDD